MTLSRPVCLIAAMIVVMAAFSLVLSAQAAPAPSVTPGADVLLRLRPQTSAVELRALLSPGDDVTLLIPELALYRLRSASSPDPVFRRLQSNSAILYAEPNYAVHVAITPDDPDYASRQWSLPAIHAPEAWDIVTGSLPITIAIIDTGIDLSHPDLIAKLVTGTTFVSGTTSAQDDYGHGTHVAGIAAASTNNGIGMAGVSWGARLMPVKVLDRTGAGTYADLIQGIYYAASHGAQILNMSLSGDSYSQALQDAIDYAYRQGCLLVAAAGNCAQGGAGCTSVNPIMYPAANNHVLSVAATDDQDRRATFSTYNSSVDIAAPGVGIYSTHWQSGVSTYFWMSGTSQAAPHVSGLAALIWSERPWLSNDSVEAIIKQTADDVNTGDYPGPDAYLGWGRVNALRAVDRTPPLSAVQPLPVAQLDPSFTVSWRGSDDNAGIHSYTIQYRDGNGPWTDWLVGVTITQATFTGATGHTYYFQSSATDRAENVEPFPGGDGDTHIHISTCSVGGRVLDNRNVAVAGARIAMQPEGQGAVSDESGNYTLVPVACSGTLSVTAGREGFSVMSPLTGLMITATTMLTDVDLYLPPRDNLIPSPYWDFESGALAPVWAAGGPVAPSLAIGQGHSGSYAVYLGTPMSMTVPGGESSIAVTVTVPLTTYRPVLSFLYRIVTMDNGLHDWFEASVNGQVVWRDSYPGPDYGSMHDLGWRHGWADLSDYRGQTIVIRLVVTQGQAYASYPTGAFIDEVSVGSSPGGANRISFPVIVANRGG